MGALLCRLHLMVGEMIMILPCNIMDTMGPKTAAETIIVGPIQRSEEHLKKAGEG